MSFRESQKRKVSLTHKKADDFIFKSLLDRPISEMSHLRQSLLFAEISMISYLDIEQCNIAAGKIGFTDGKFFNSNGAQAYWFKNKHDSVVVCRGTEANDWNDIEADMNAVTALAETVGKVHRGFKAEVDQIWPHIEKELEANDRPLWFCGHSLGGAMATICAGRATISYIKSEPEGLFTYGSPRVGCRRYANHVKINHSRWVNNNDIVTRVPPAWFGYRHSGAEYYLDRFGNLKDAKGWSRFKDRLKGFLGGLRKGKLDQLSDHSIVEYIDTIHGLARIEGPQLPLSIDSKNEASKPATSSQEPERANQTVSESTPNRQTA
ncbi:MAG: lipase family protein [Planctomycetota bacterium]